MASRSADRGVPAAAGLDAAVAVEKLLATSPEAAQFLAELEELTKAAWQGEFPPIFFLSLGNTLDRLPWLVDRRGINPALVRLLNRFNERAIEGYESWPNPPNLRATTGFIQLEGLLLLGRLEAPDQVSAHEQLARILDLVSAGLVSDVHGTSSRRKRRHPLKGVFRGLGQPQTTAEMAAALKRAVGEIWRIYPQVASFLESTYLALICGHPLRWPAYPDGPTTLGLDADPNPDRVTVPTIDLDLPRQQLRPLTSSDLRGELEQYLGTDAYAGVIEALTPLWRHEASWQLLEAVHRLSHTLPWLAPRLAKVVDLSALREAGQCHHGKHQRLAFKRVSKWRRRHSIKPHSFTPPPALLAPSDRQRRLGLLHLRGLLALGRLCISEAEGADADDALSGAINKLVRGVAPDSNSWHVFPLEEVVNRIGDPKSFGELLAALQVLMPDIRGADPEFADLLERAYLPLLRAAGSTQQPLSGGHADGKINKTVRKEVRGKRRPKSASVRTVRVRIQTRETPVKGEATQESTPSHSYKRRSSPTDKPLPLKDEMRWHQHRGWGINPLLVRDHIESLSNPEAKLVVALASARIKAAIRIRDIEDARVGILTLVTLASGQDPRTLAVADDRLPHDGATTRPRLSLQGGWLELPVLRPENAYEPAAAGDGLPLEASVDRLLLPLPDRLVAWIDEVLAIDTSAWTWEPDALLQSMTAYVAALDAQIGSGISLSRVRNTARACIREATGDTAATMILTGSSHGRPTTPLYYYSAPAQVAEEGFRQSTKVIFGDSRGKGQSYLNSANARVGSKLLATRSTTNLLARTPSAALNAPIRTRDGEHVASQHNPLVDHALCMLMAVAGHRPVRALVGMTRFDFDTGQSAAVFSDKRCDPAHYFRYVPTAELVSEQVESYIRHLRTVAADPACKKPLAQRAREALRGDAPLFFKIANCGGPAELEFDEWSKSLPAPWQKIPMNWGRTWLASRGREHGLDPDHLAVLLGHLESTGYPFSSESPLEPSQLAMAMSGPLGRLARSSGWVVRKGLGGKASAEATEQEAGPLRSWKNERDALAREMRAFKVEQRLLLRSQMRGARQSGEKLAHRELRALVGSEIPDFKQIFERTIPTEPASSMSGAAISMSGEDLLVVEERIEQAAGADKVLLIAAHNGLHRYLKRAVKHLGWHCQVPSPWILPASMEPTQFFSGMFRATLQVRLLREAFSGLPSAPPTGSGFSEFEWAVGICSLAICIFSFESNEEHIFRILAGRNTATTSSTFDDLLLVQTQCRNRVSGIRGLAAIALARLNRDFPAEAAPSPERLDLVLAALIRPELSGGSQNLLARLCATVSVSNLSELSGLARCAIDANEGCVAMPVLRQRQFLEEGHGASQAEATPAIGHQADIALRKVRCKPSEALMQYRALRRTLFIGTGPKYFSLTGKKLTQANVGAFRQPLLRELEAMLAKENLSPLVSLVASQALRLTRDGTSEKSEPAWSTVYEYITVFAGDLVELGRTKDLHELDADEFLNLYQGVIDRKTSDGVKMVATRELAAFHSMLVEHHGFDPVDFSAIEGTFAIPEKYVDAELVQPQELKHGLESLDAFVERPPDGVGTNRIRLARQTRVFTLLLGATGARHEELAAARFKDLVATEDATVAFVRRSRYRRLKTSAARRMIDCTSMLSRQQRIAIRDWVSAETARLGSSWKSTLPIFGELGAPRNRVRSNELRDAALGALADAIGYRSKIHRVRHLVATEGLTRWWLSNTDSDRLRVSRIRAGRHAKGWPKPSPVALPRNVRQESIRLGHRRNSTTVLNYFHMQWMVLSRPHESLAKYAGRRSAGVVLGVAPPTADKIIQRAKSGNRTGDHTGKWLMSVIGKPTSIPGENETGLRTPASEGVALPLTARQVEQALTHIQKGVSVLQVATSLGLTESHRVHLLAAAQQVQSRVGFTLIPEARGMKAARTARKFQSTGAATQLLDLFDSGSETEKNEVRQLASSYLTWASKSRRSEVLWPAQDATRLASVLRSLGMAGQSIRTEAVQGRPGFEKVTLLRDPNGVATNNHAIAWSLVAIQVTIMMHALESCAHLSP